MTDKEMIEEMAQFIPSDIVRYDGVRRGQHLYIEQKYEIAEELLKHYQPKLPECSVVLSKEVFEDYMRNARQVEEGAEVCYNCHNEYAEKIAQARKETAREICQKLYDETIREGRPAVYNILSPTDIKELAKRYGVEIKE